MQSAYTGGTILSTMTGNAAIVFVIVVLAYGLKDASAYWAAHQDAKAEGKQSRWNWGRFFEQFFQGVGLGIASGAVVSAVEVLGDSGIGG